MARFKLVTQKDLNGGVEWMPQFSVIINVIIRWFGDEFFLFCYGLDIFL